MKKTIAVLLAATMPLCALANDDLPPVRVVPLGNDGAGAAVDVLNKAWWKPWTWSGKTWAKVGVGTAAAVGSYLIYDNNKDSGSKSSSKAAPVAG